jgi:hypothetical protein
MNSHNDCSGEDGLKRGWIELPMKEEDPSHKLEKERGITMLNPTNPKLAIISAEIITAEDSQ